MRKVKSCPQLAGMDLAFSCGLRCKTLSSASLLTKRVEPPSSPPARASSLLTIGAKRQQRSTACHAFMLASTPENVILNSADEMLMETSFGRGLVGAECFEQFGFQPSSAPSLVDGKQAFQMAMENEKEGLAACLASPIMPDDRSLGEMVQSAIKKALIETEMSVQMRYVEEVKKEDLSDSLMGRNDRRRKRRASEEHFDHIMEGHLAVYGGPIVKSPQLSSSPETQGILSRLSVWEDCSNNTLTVDDEFCNPETGFCCEEPDLCLFSIDADATQAVAIENKRIPTEI